MYSLYTPSPLEEPLSRWQQVCHWARQNDRCQKYQKDDLLDCESGWIYFVQRGVVRLNSQPTMSNEIDAVPSVLGLVGVGQPFELERQRYLSVKAVSHVKNTEVFWVHASEIATVPGFEIDVLQAFRYQHQQQMLQLNNLTQGRAVDRLLGYLYLLGEEFGEEEGQDLNLPFSLTHAQLAGAIGSTRVTVTRLLGELRKYGNIQMWGGNKISLPRRKKSTSYLQLVE
jgi:Crp-like helix-turn-helix domain